MAEVGRSDFMTVPTERINPMTFQSYHAKAADRRRKQQRIDRLARSFLFVIDVLGLLTLVSICAFVYSLTS